MTNAEYARLRASYAAACASWQRATGRIKPIELACANLLWKELAIEVSRRNIERGVWRRV